MSRFTRWRKKHRPQLNGVRLVGQVIIDEVSKKNLPILNHCESAKVFICSPAFAEAVRKEYSNWQVEKGQK